MFCVHKYAIILDIVYCINRYHAVPGATLPLFINIYGLAAGSVFTLHQTRAADILCCAGIY